MLPDTHQAQLLALWKHAQGAWPTLREFSPQAQRDLPPLQEEKLVRLEGERLVLTLAGLKRCSTDAWEEAEGALFLLKELYLRKRTRRWQVEELASQTGQHPAALGRILSVLTELPIWILHRVDPDTGFVTEFALSDTVLIARADRLLPGDVKDAPEKPLSNPLALSALEVDGFRPFVRLRFEPGECNVVYGPSGSGKSSLLDFFRFLSFAVQNPMPPSIDPRGEDRRIFTSSLPEAIRFSLTFSSPHTDTPPLRYEGEIHGEGPPRVFRERLTTVVPPDAEEEPFVFLALTRGRGFLFRSEEGRLAAPGFLTKPNELALGAAQHPERHALRQVFAALSSIRVYAGFDTSFAAALRHPAPLQTDSHLKEDGSNLCAVLFGLKTSHPERWEALQQELTALPGFLALDVEEKEGTLRGIFHERDIRDPLTFADLSDGFLRFLCLATVCLSPDLPGLLCLDDPAEGLDASLLPALAGMIKKVAQKTQVLLTTSSEPMARAFAPDQVFFLSKERGQPVLRRG